MKTFFTVTGPKEELLDFIELSLVELKAITHQMLSSDGTHLAVISDGSISKDCLFSFSRSHPNTRITRKTPSTMYVISLQDGSLINEYHYS